MPKAAKAETRAAVIAAVLAGTSQANAAQMYSVSPSTVSKWINAYQYGKVSKLETQKKESSLSELIQTYAIVILQNLIAQAQVTSDPGYIMGQDADKLAIFHGVLADKGLRVIERLAEAAERQRHRTIEGSGDNF